MVVPKQISQIVGQWRIVNYHKKRYHFMKYIIKNIYRFHVALYKAIFCYFVTVPESLTYFQQITFFTVPDKYF